MISKNQSLPEISLNHLPSGLEWKTQGKNIFRKARENYYATLRSIDDNRSYSFRIPFRNNQLLRNGYNNRIQKINMPANDKKKHSKPFLNYYEAIG